MVRRRGFLDFKLKFPSAGNLLELDEVPLTIALQELRSVHRTLTLHSLDGGERDIDAGIMRRHFASCYKP
jgi:hypothetical protein